MQRDKFLHSVQMHTRNSKGSNLQEIQEKSNQSATQYGGSGLYIHATKLIAF